MISKVQMFSNNGVKYQSKNNNTSFGTNACQIIDKEPWLIKTNCTSFISNLIKKCKNVFKPLSTKEKAWVITPDCQSVVHALLEKTKKGSLIQVASDGTKTTVTRLKGNALNVNLEPTINVRNEWYWKYNETTGKDEAVGILNAIPSPRGFVGCDFTVFKNGKVIKRDIDDEYKLNVKYNDVDKDFFSVNKVNDFIRKYLFQMAYPIQ